MGLDQGLNPSIENLESELSSELEKNLAAYLLGGLIFTGYAQLMEAEHILQPKRSRVLLALAMGKDASAYQLEKHLFDELKKRAGNHYEELPWMPTFFPYLLSKAQSPDSMLQEVIKLRRSPEIKEYRAWLRDVMQDFKVNGRISTKKIKNVQSIAKHIDRVIGCHFLYSENGVKGICY